MRTIVEIDAENFHHLEKLRAVRARSFGEVLNDMIRRALRAEHDRNPEPPFVVVPRAMGLRPGIDPEYLNKLVDDLEADGVIDA